MRTQYNAGFLNLIYVKMTSGGEAFALLAEVFLCAKMQSVIGTENSGREMQY